MKIRIGSRGSALALWQANHIRDRLLALETKDGTRPVADVEITIIRTTGDRIQDVALSEIGGKGLFTKELEEALYANAIDIAVHSMKDMPSELPPGLSITAVPSREDARDALVLPLGTAAPDGDDPYAALPEGAVVGTSSLRRRSQLLAARPDLKVIPLRGNVDTRLRKLDEGEGGLQAIILASAGLKRLGWGDRISVSLEVTSMLPAVGQGALAIESVTDRYDIKHILELLDDAPTRHATLAERAFLATLEGNCQVPLAAFATVNGKALHIQGLVASPSGTVVHQDAVSGDIDDAEALGVLLAGRLIGAGADEILREFSLA